MNEELMDMLFDAEEVKNSIKEEDTRYSHALFDKIYYKPTGVKPGVAEMIDTSKYDTLLENIEKSNVSETDKKFLRLAAARHLVFMYDKIADYYTNSSPEVQDLMEQSALVILDLHTAIANGYVKCAQRIDEVVQKDFAINMQKRAEKAAAKEAKESK